MSENTPATADANAKAEVPTTSTPPASSDIDVEEVAPITPKSMRVPRSQRRGLLAQLQLIPELTNPYHHSNPTKWLITTIVALAATTSSSGSSIFYRKSCSSPILSPEEMEINQFGLFKLPCSMSRMTWVLRPS